MGHTKALIRLGGEMCITRVLRACREGGTAAPIVVLGHDAKAVLGALPDDVTTCTNTEYRTTGPARSLQVGLRHLPDNSEAFLLFPVDFPLVSGQDVAALLEAWDSARDRGVRIVVPSHGMRRGHPALFHRSLADVIDQLGTDEPLHQVVRSNESCLEHVEMDTPWVVTDMDTPDDHRRMEEALRTR